LNPNKPGNKRLYSMGPRKQRDSQSGFSLTKRGGTRERLKKRKDVRKTTCEEEKGLRSGPAGVVGFRGRFKHTSIL